MRVLFLTQYFPPEMGAAPNRISYLAKSFAEHGHEVTVLTALPNYPEGTIFEGYRGRAVMEEDADGMHLVRVWCYATRSKAFWRRMLNYLSFMFTSVFLGIWRIERPDVMIVESPPIFLGVSGLLLKWRLRTKLVFNVSDLWPESAIAMGIVRNRLLIRAATALEETIYRCSDLISAQTRGIMNDIQRRMPDKAVTLLTNGADLAELATRGPNRGAIRRSLDAERKFVVGYAGLHGLAQRLETVVEAAAKLTAYSDIMFVFLGDGPEKAALVGMAGQLGLENVKFYPPQPKSELIEIVSTFDAAIIPLRNLPLYQGALPSKMFEAMGVGTPVICAVPGEAHAVIQESGGGICIPPENPDEMANAILQLYRQPELRKAMGAAAKEYVSRHYNRATIARNFEELLTRFVASDQGRIPPMRVGDAGQGAD